MDQLNTIPPPAHNVKRIILIAIVSVITIILLTIGSFFFIKYSRSKRDVVVSKPEIVFSFDHYISKFGVEIDYPRGWQAKEVAGELGAGIWFFPPDIDASQLSKFDVDEPNRSLSISFVTFFDEGRSFNLEGEILKLSASGQLIEKRDATVNGRQATIFSYKANNINFLSLVIGRTSGGYQAGSVVTYKAPAEIYSNEEARALISSFKDNILETLLAHEEEERKQRIEHKRSLVDQMGDIVVNYLPAFVKADPGSSASGYSLIQNFTCNGDNYKTFIVTKTIIGKPSSWGQTIEERVAGWRKGGNDVIEINVNQNKGFLGKSRGSPFEIVLPTPNAYFFLQNLSCDLSEEEIIKIARSIR